MPNVPRKPIAKLEKGVLGELSKRWVTLNRCPEGYALTMLDGRNDNRQKRSDFAIEWRGFPERSEPSGRLVEALQKLEVHLVTDLKGLRLRLALRKGDKSIVHGTTRMSSIRDDKDDDRGEDEEENERAMGAAGGYISSAFTEWEAMGAERSVIARGMIREMLRWVDKDDIDDLTEELG